MNIGIIGHGKQKIEEAARNTSLTDLGVISPDEERIEIARTTYNAMVEELQRLKDENDDLQKYKEKIELIQGMKVDPSTIEIFEDFDVETCRKKYIVKFTEDRFSHGRDLRSWRNENYI